ncbi:MULTISPECIES: hypothetical protein [unclassified Tenacibaculum]|uniref:hypothetical protein n=1 Tax=unclassified Tenacibaculum TaxID=2635139 RepID=UPI001F1BC024|nr:MULTISPECIES: hypothetical protein [unclassified Tenacibaculum]MCF2875572.1 hypothetical protein [Tenacibaculum sp. Cn5-1]MCF2935648.1 hypothetical protein [Tenacibaculum sp. Cn5-34]MCG7512208.1 hypothetical protein [Tenacibaculum sp. Cn5-46]
MENSYDQLNIEYVETKKVSSFVKYSTIILILIFAFIPLAELIDVLDYNYAAPHTIHLCISDLPIEPLQFKSLPLSN